MRLGKHTITLARAYNQRIRAMRGLAPLEGFSCSLLNTRAQETNQRITQAISQRKPYMVARYGSVELGCLVDHLWNTRPNPWLDLLRGEIIWKGWRKTTLRGMANNAGFFPATEDTLARFAELMLEDSKHVDLLGSWQKEEALLASHHPQVRRGALGDIEPFDHEDPWSAALEGKRVLVIHPFEDSIRHQYARREILFKDPRMLPGFEMRVIKAVQSIAGTPTPFASWFEALEFMKTQMDSCEYDVALIGCGAYGFPLAAHAKRRGKTAIHLGGALQLLFGIRGARWEKDPTRNGLINEHWIRPLESERPANFGKVEKGCYW